MKDFCLRLEADYKDGKNLSLEQYKMDFHKSPNNIMGGFNLVKHHPTKKNKETIKLELNNQEDPVENDQDYVIYEFVVESSWLLQYVILHLEFGTLDKDDLNNGYLKAYSILTLDGKEIYKATRGGQASIDFSSVKQSFLYFIYGQYVCTKWEEEYIYRLVDGFEPIDEDKELQKFNNFSHKIINNLGFQAYLRLIEWQQYNYGYSHKDLIYSRDGKPILDECLDDTSIVNSPTLDVFCYFPCLDYYKDIKKSEVKKEIFNKIESHNSQVSSLNQKIIKIFLDSFEASEANTLHEFISHKENNMFFVKTNINTSNNGFSFPMNWFDKEVFYTDYDESNLPESANWYITILAMDLINKITTEKSKTFLTYDNENRPYYAIEDKIDGFLRKIIEDVFVHLLPGSLEYSPTTVVQPRRMYSLEENSDFSRTLKKYFETKRIFEASQNSLNSLSTQKYRACSFINKWLRQLEIAHHVEIISHADGYGVTIHLYADEEDHDGMLLVDKGFGVVQLFSVLLKIEVSILEMKSKDKMVQNNGYNQDLFERIRTWNQIHPVTVALEEPECHLHPSLQSKFADMIVDAYKLYGVHFIIESHSEYLIRKLQLLVSLKEIKNKEISLLYVNPSSRPAYLPVITDIGLEEDGCLKNEFGPGFFDESIRLGNELLKHKEDDDNKKEKDEDQA